MQDPAANGREQQCQSEGGQQECQLRPEHANLEYGHIHVRRVIMPVWISIMHVLRMQLHTIGVYIRVQMQARALKNEQRDD